jgi:ABC-type polysaccharide/polyol phosphate export permease
MTLATTSETHSNDTFEWPPTPSNLARALDDLFVGFRKSWLWMELASRDIGLRYRGSMLGPFWMTISTIIMISSMGFLYAKLFHQDAASYLPYLTVGLVIWNFAAGVVTEGCGTFTSVQGLIQQVPMPYSIHAYRLVYRNILVLAHSFVIIPAVMYIFGISPSWRIFWVVPALLVLAVNGAWCSILFGMVSARFRDVPPIVSSFLTVIFFLTPIMWPPSALGAWQHIGELNPLFAAIDVVRAPILGQAVAPHSWLVLIATTVIGCLVTFAIFVRFRSRIAFWV